VIILAFVTAAQVALAAQPTPVTGYWEGAVTLPGMNLAIQVTFTQADGEALEGRISVPAQSMKDVKLEDVVLDMPEISFKIADVRGNPTFSGRAEDDVIKGEFTQHGRSFPFELKRVEGIEGPKPVAEPTLPKGLIERGITVGASPWELPGTLTLPGGSGPFPAAILVHGSGPNDRNETIGHSRPFRDIAWGLAENGIAVLRYDKRTLVHGKKISELKNFTLNEESVDDAVLAVKEACLVQEINSGKVFVIGHSLGSYALARIAEKSPNAAGFVSLAGAARPIEELLQEQFIYQDAPEAEIAKLKEQIAKLKSEDLSPDTPAGELPLGIPASFWLDLRGYDPVAALAKSKRPALILQGEADCQVTMTDFALWKKGFPDAAHESFPKLNHLFMPVEGKSTGMEYFAEGQRVDPGVIQAIAAWIKVWSTDADAKDENAI